MGREFTAAALAEAIGARLLGDRGRLLDGAAGLEEAGPGEVSFFSGPRYRTALTETRAGVVILDEAAAAAPGAPATTLLICAAPIIAYARVLELFHPPTRPAAGIHRSAEVAADAEVDPSATVMALCYVGPGAKVGPGTVLRPQVHIGAGATLGSDCEVHPHVVVGDHCVLGDRVVLHAGVVLGSDGFGYVLDQGDDGPFHRKIPQVGIVRIEDDVEIGAGTCVDRATTGETLVGQGSKIDNQVQVGHNCSIGALSILCGQTGLAGSTRLGVGVVLAGGVGVGGHVEIGDAARVGAGSGVLSSIPAGETWTGYPAGPHAGWLRMSAALRRLPGLLRRLRVIERHLNERSQEDEDA